MYLQATKLFKSLGEIKNLPFLSIVALSFGLWVGCSSEETGGPGAPEPAGEEEEEGSGVDEETE